MKALTISALALAVAALHSISAYAGSQVLADTTLVSGSSSEVFSFQASGPGMATVELTNVAWPQNLSSLSFLATAPGEILGQWSNPPASGGTTTQTMSFMVPTAGTYFADVMATAGGPLDLGVYSLSISFSPSAVPLPPSGRLLLGALLLGVGLLFVQQRRRQRAAATA
jgi:hypothetical protein